MSLRRFRSLLRGLPMRDTVIGTKLGVRQVGEWGNVEELLAVNAEVTDAGNRLFYSAHTKKGTPAPKPLKIPRPERTATAAAGGAKPASKKRRPATSEEMRAFFGGAVRYTGPPVEGTADADN